MRNGAMRNRHTDAEHHVSATDRIGNGIIAGFIATLALSAVHEPVALVTEAVGRACAGCRLAVPLFRRYAAVGRPVRLRA